MESQQDRPSTHSLYIDSCGHQRYSQHDLPSFSRPHGRLDYQLLYVNAGKATYTLEGRAVAVTAGQIVLYHPNQPQQYSYFCRDTPEIFWIHFAGHTANECLNACGFANKNLYTVGRSNLYLELFHKLIKEQQLKKPCYQQLNSAYLLELLSLMGRQRAILAQGSAGKHAATLYAIVESMHADYSSSQTIEQYATMAGMSTCWFIRSFKQLTGVPPHQYVREIRINKAKELLQMSTLTLNEIATSVGFSDPLYFSRIFRQQVGEPPSQYRTRLR